jgi:hypothetical protein
MDFRRIVGGLASPLPLAGEAAALAESAAGEGSCHRGITSAYLDNPAAATPPPPTLPRKREREPSPDAEASFTPSAIALGHLVIDHRNADRVVAA